MDTSPSSGLHSTDPYVKRWGDPQDPAAGDIHYYNYKVLRWYSSALHTGNYIAEAGSVTWCGSCTCRHPPHVKRFSHGHALTCTMQDDCLNPDTYPRPRFVSEYGYQSFASYHAVRPYGNGSAGDWTPFSPFMRHRYVRRSIRFGTAAAQDSLIVALDHTSNMSILPAAGRVRDAFPSLHHPTAVPREVARGTCSLPYQSTAQMRNAVPCSVGYILHLVTVVPFALLQAAAP